MSLLVSYVLRTTDSVPRAHPGRPRRTMPESVQNQQDRPSASSKLVLTSPDNETKRSPLSRRRSKTESSGSKIAWVDVVDVDAATPRGKKQDKSSPTKNNRSRSRTESSSFIPKLTRILETGESRTVGKPGKRVQHSGQRRAPSPTRVRKAKEERGAVKISPVKAHVGPTRRRSNTLPRLNPSLISVLSTLTRASDQSSGSNTTITQQSYDRMSKSSKGQGFKREYSRASVSESNIKRMDMPSVFDYMESTEDNGQDAHSIRSSSSSSHYQPSDAGSSELPDTPSSASTFPSPTATRSGSISGSVAELRRKYDAQYASSVDSRRSGSRSPEEGRSPPRSIKRLSQLRDVAEAEESESDESLRFDEVVYDGKRSPSHSHAAQLPPAHQHHDERLIAQQDALRQHVSQDQKLHIHHRADSAYGQQRSHSSSSNRSMGSQRAWAQYTHDKQVQQYPYASPAASMVSPVPHHPMYGHVAHNAPPPAPDAPDNTQQTIMGYELLARELSDKESTVQPIYRKFEYLNHRILLHMQDELQEMEEQLRRIDEIIAREEIPAPDGNAHPPNSRRGDKHYGSHWHHQRTELLGRIFLKTKDYNAAVASFASMTKDSTAAEKPQVEIYREWLAQKTPIHELETRFLAAESEHDLILPGTPRRVSPAPNPVDNNQQHLIALAFLPMLPLLLFSIIPTLAGRLMVTLLITTGAVLIAATTRIGNLMPLYEWMVCAAAYVLVSAGVAGCVPQHT